MVYRIFVEKKPGLDNEARALKGDINELLQIKGVEKVRVFNRYDVENLAEDLFKYSVHTVFASDWCHYFNLRALGTTGSPRPSSKEVAWPLMIEFMSRGYISTSDINSEKYDQIIEKFDNIEDYIKL